jgi:hypothetical protein
MLFILILLLNFGLVLPGQLLLESVEKEQGYLESIGNQRPNRAQLWKLDLSGKKLKDFDLLRMFSSKVQVLDCSSNWLSSIKIPDEHWVSLQARTLRRIDYSENSIANVTFWDLLHLKRAIPSLKKIILNDNPLTEESIQEIEIFLSETVRLNENKMSVKYGEE